jgi:hypothetical protein
VVVSTVVVSTVVASGPVVAAGAGSDVAGSAAGSDSPPQAEKAIRTTARSSRRLTPRR